MDNPKKMLTKYASNQRGGGGGQKYQLRTSNCSDDEEGDDDGSNSSQTEINIKTKVIISDDKLKGGVVRVGGSDEELAMESSSQQKKQSQQQVLLLPSSSRDRDGGGGASDAVPTSGTRKSIIRLISTSSEDRDRMSVPSSGLALSISSKQSETKDECSAFAELVSLKLQKFDDVSRLKIQHQINCVLYDAEMSVLKRKK